MKKFGILALIAFFAAGFSVFAQPQEQNRTGQKGNWEGRPQGMAMSAQQRAENMTKQLNLTDAQKGQLVEFFQKQNKIREEKRIEREKQRDQMMQDQNKTREEFRAEREKEMALQNAELEKIIGKDKMAELQKIRQERMDKMNANRGQRPEMNKKDAGKQKNDSVLPVDSKKSKKAKSKI